MGGDDEGDDVSDQEEHRADVLPAQPPKQPRSLANHLFYVVTEPGDNAHVTNIISIIIICIFHPPDLPADSIEPEDTDSFYEDDQKDGCG